MIQKIKSTLLTGLAVLGIASAPLLVVGQPVYADPGSDGSASSKMSEGLDKAGGSQNKTTLEDQIKTITNVLLFLLGAIAVIMIIVGGIRYVISNGEASSIKSAKDTILYAVIGLIVAILAFAIVNFVITSFSGSTK